MSEFLGAHISLISKSDIRYSGVLHEINSEESTVSLENVKSYGTEGRKGKPEEEIPAAEQIYEYIVFRGSDVKDLRIEEGPAAKENHPPAVPNDPAIVGARPRPVNPPAPGFHHGLPGGPGFGHNMPMPPPGADWGPPRGLQYPPPGWFPPGQGFPPAGPVPWNNFYPPGPPGIPGFQGNRQPPPQTPENKPAPIGAGVDKQKSTQLAELASEPKSLGQAPIQPQAANAPVPPVESKPSVEEVKATAASLSMNGHPASAESSKPIPTGPRVTRITPAVPLPAALVNKASQQTMAAAAKQGNEQSAAANATALRDATQAAKAAVAVAMAKLDGNAALAAQNQQNGSAMDNLTKKVNEMRVNAARTDSGSTASRTSRGRGGRPAKVEVPDADFDFASSNAKFNKEDVVKEAIASSPLAETPNGSVSEAQDAATSANPPQAYNKSRSFFDNISSESKERAENRGQKPGGREWRGEEQRKNMETFGQGSVDGGYRGYRGRGRGRGTRGRGFGGRGGRGGFRRNNDSQVTAQTQ